jgi:hypothetical protein
MPCAAGRKREGGGVRGGRALRGGERTRRGGAGGGAHRLGLEARGELRVAQVRESLLEEAHVLDAVDHPARAEVLRWCLARGRARGSGGAGLGQRGAAHLSLGPRRGGCDTPLGGAGGGRTKISNEVARARDDADVAHATQKRNAPCSGHRGRPRAAGPPGAAPPPRRRGGGARAARRRRRRRRRRLAADGPPPRRHGHAGQGPLPRAHARLLRPDLRGAPRAEAPDRVARV